MRRHNVETYTRRTKSGKMVRVAGHGKGSDTGDAAAASPALVHTSAAGIREDPFGAYDPLLNDAVTLGHINADADELTSLDTKLDAFNRHYDAVRRNQSHAEYEQSIRDAQALLDTPDDMLIGAEAGADALWGADLERGPYRIMNTIEAVQDFGTHADQRELIRKVNVALQDYSATSAARKRFPEAFYVFRYDEDDHGWYEFVDASPGSPMTPRYVSPERKNEGDAGDLPVINEDEEGYLLPCADPRDPYDSNIDVCFANLNAKLSEQALDFAETFGNHGVTEEVYTGYLTRSMQADYTLLGPPRGPEASYMPSRATPVHVQVKADEHLSDEQIVAAHENAARRVLRDDAARANERWVSATRDVLSSCPTLDREERTDLILRHLP